MVDISTGLTVLGTAIGTKDLIVKVLGPTADYLGEGLKNWTQRRKDNLARTFEAAARKLPVSPPTGEAVPPRVLKAVLNDASFAEDPLTAEYFGGVLACSRSGVSRDDRGTALAALISRLSTYQIRAHYVFYSVIRLVHSGSSQSVLVEKDRNALRVFIPYSIFVDAMALEAGEELSSIVSHVLFGLAKEDLIAPHFAFGGLEHLKPLAPAADTPGCVVGPSALGVELFFWANGLGRHPLIEFLKPETAIQPLAEVNIEPGSVSADPSAGV